MPPKKDKIRERNVSGTYFTLPIQLLARIRQFADYKWTIKDAKYKKYIYRIKFELTERTEPLPRVEPIDTFTVTDTLENALQKTIDTVMEQGDEWRAKPMIVNGEGKNQTFTITINKIRIFREE